MIMGYTYLADFVHPRMLVRSAGTYFSYFTQSVIKEKTLLRVNGGESE